MDRFVLFSLDNNFLLLNPRIANCVSHTTLPHFVRFLFYTVAGMSHLGCLLWSRMYHLWTQRNLPSVRELIPTVPIAQVSSYLSFSILVQLPTYFLVSSLLLH